MRHRVRDGLTSVRGAIVIALLAGGVSAMPPIAAQHSAAAPQCRPQGPLVPIPQLPEASGLAASRRVPGRLWAINDSGPPLVYMLDPQGTVTRKVALEGATVTDWEAIAVGPCAAGSCLYVADIGDNDTNRERVTIYRLPEPANEQEPAPRPEVFHARYPDEPHDAESLLLMPDGVLYIVTKEPRAIYRLPRELRADTTAALERVGEPRETGTSGRDERITDGAVSPDGKWVVLRTGRSLRFYSAAELTTGNWQATGVLDLGDLGEPQGEGVAFGPDNVLYLAGEGGGKSQPGTLARLICTFGR
jgi:hypothetical protein